MKKYIWIALGILLAAFSARAEEEHWTREVVENGVKYTEYCSGEKPHPIRGPGGSVLRRPDGSVVRGGSGIGVGLCARLLPVNEKAKQVPKVKEKKKKGYGKIVSDKKPQRP